jgi:hypothetical protein
MPDQEQIDLYAQLNQVDPANQPEAEELSPEVSDLPQEVTETYGTGVHPVERLEVRGGALPGELAEYFIPSPGLTAADEDAVWNQSDALNDAVGDNPVLTGGDIDAAWDQADTVGDEAVGGTVATPDQDIVDAIGAAVGLEMSDDTDLQTNDILNERDNARWELDPMSSEDYPNRLQERESGDEEGIVE